MSQSRERDTTRFTRVTGMLNWRVATRPGVFQRPGMASSTGRARTLPPPRLPACPLARALLQTAMLPSATQK